MKNTMKRFSKHKIAVVLGTLFTCANGNAVAEQNNSTDEKIEVVTVVGHKLTELSQENNGGALGNRTILDTPFSVDVISLDDIEIRQVNTLSSLFSREASVSVDGSAYSSFGDTIRVRGLGLDYTQSFKINGLSINSFSGELPYEAFEQVTLIKGATGFMYGMAAPGGIVNYITKRAHDDAVSASVGYRSDSVYSGHLDASTRFGSNDSTGVRVNLVKEKGDTYLDNGEIDRETVSLAFDTQLTDSLHWTVDVIANERLISNSWNRFSVTMDSSEALPKTVDGARNIGIDGTFDRYENLIALSTLTWEINDNWSMQFDYDYSKNETRWVKSLGYLRNSQGDLSFTTYEQYFDVDYDQVQALIKGQFATGNITHNIVAGAYYQIATTYRNDGGKYGRKVTRGYAVDNLFTPMNVTAYQADLQKDAPEAWNDTQRSIFVSDFISLNDHWELLFGIRSNDVEHNTSDYFATYHDDYQDTAVSPTAAVMYKPNNQTTFYASYVEAFEGQISAVGEEYENANELLPPLESSQYEIGFKQAGAGWSMSSALFRIERGATLVTDNNYLIQDGVTLYQGLEFSGAYEISENLSLYGDLMLLDAEYDKTNTPVEGNDVGGAPKRQFSLQTNYNVASVPGLTLNLGGKYHGETALDANNHWELPAYTVFYGGVSYSTTVANHKLTLIGTVDNLFDKQYWAIGDSYGGGNMRIGEPRTVAFKVKMDF